MYPTRPETSKNPLRKSGVTALLLVGSIALSACSESDDTSVDNGAPSVNDDQSGVDGNDAVVPGEDDKEFADTVDPNDYIPPTSEGSIADRLLDDTQYSILLGLVQRADLADALSDNNSGAGWTLFAPSDDAFETDAFDAMTAEQRNALVRNHVYSGELEYVDLKPGSLSMVEGSVEIMLGSQGMKTVGGARIVAKDRRLNNGVIHFVDSLLQAN